MFENFTLIALIIILVWVALYAYYLITSRQQRQIEMDLKNLDKLLSQDEDE